MNITKKKNIFSKTQIESYILSKKYQSEKCNLRQITKSECMFKKVS